MNRHIHRHRVVAIASLLACVAGSALAQECQVKLGAVGPMSGGASQYGLSVKAGAELAAAMANQDGGLQMGNRKCKVTVVSFDSQYTAAGGAAASNYLASENTHVTVGPLGSPETAAFRPVAKRHGQVFFTFAYLKDAISAEYPLGFHAQPAPATWGTLLVKAAKDQFKFNSVIIVGPNDQGGTDGSKQLMQLYGDAGVKAVTEYFQRGTTNFAPLATRIMNANPQAVEMSTVPAGDATILTKQLMEAGYKGVIGSLGGIGSKPILEGAGGPANLKAFYWLEASPVDHPGIVKMKADYERVMKAPAPESPIFPGAVLSAEVALQGISKAGTDQDPEKVAEAMRTNTPQSRYMGKSAGWRGKSHYGINQELTFPVGLGMVIDGKKQAVKVIDIPAE